MKKYSYNCNSNKIYTNIQLSVQYILPFHFPISFQEPHVPCFLYIIIQRWLDLLVGGSGVEREAEITRNSLFQYHNKYVNSHRLKTSRESITWFYKGFPSYQGFRFLIYDLEHQVYLRWKGNAPLAGLVRLGQVRLI